VEKCEIAVNSGFTILTGPQAAGKSTIAKAVFFFRTVKNDICDEIIKSITYKNKEIFKAVRKKLKLKFMQLFGSSYCMRRDTEMSCRYGKNTNIQIKLSDESSFIHVKFTQNITDCLNADHTHDTKEIILSELSELFHDDYETIFIPAGRSVITLLADHLNYMFASMDEDQKSRIDYCTLKYVETILKIRPSFMAENEIGFQSSSKYIEDFMQISGDLLKGSYRYENREDRIYLPDHEDKRYVKINYASSGQQEIVWMINILFYLLKKKSKYFVIIEEPEAHLYPNAQKEISELISVFVSAGNQVLITTHSPYVLGALNNSIYAYGIAEKYPGQEKNIQRILNRERRIETCDAYFVDKGENKSCIGKQDHLIENSVIDGASQEINDCFDSLFRIEYAENAPNGDTDVPSKE